MTAVRVTSAAATTPKGGASTTRALLPSGACYAILEDMAREQQAEIYAEDAWLRAVENRWDPDEDRERMPEALGPPPGY